MGKKSRAAIEKKFTKQQYLRYRKMLLDPEYKALCEELNMVNKQLAANPADSLYRELYWEKERIENDLKNKYSLSVLFIDTLSDHSWQTFPEDERKVLERLIDPKNPLTEEEFEDFPDPVFDDIVQFIPFKKPGLIQRKDLTTEEWVKMVEGKRELNPGENIIIGGDTDWLRDDRYLTVEIDTQNTIERIVAAIKDMLEFLRDEGIIKFKSRVHLSTEEERIRAKELEAQGKTLKEIAYEMWPDRWEEEERKIAQKENVEGEERILYEQYVQRRHEEGKTYLEAFDEADKEFGLKKRKITNPLIIKVYYLLSEKSK
jgi:hypothetical protein